ncbi:MAG TPA: response regulator [Polyangiales bacterium]|nr:response regulator [Polyangiales bacterium]
MTRILTVDDSRAVRMLVKKALTDMAFDIDEAEDGEKGLAAVEQNQPDLILLDVTMPVLDGPGMLERLRGRGIPTPVILLTAESGTSVIGPMLKQGGICEYIVKPFKPEQLRAKVIEALQKNGTVPMPTAPKQASAEGGGFQQVGKTFVDVLVIDDMENVSKKLKTMLPERLTFNSCADRGSALSMCRERVYRTVVLDTDIPDVDSLELLRELRILQPTAAFVALVMKAEKNPHQLVSGTGFAGFLNKPFDPRQVEEFIAAYFESQDLMEVDGNVLRPAAYRGAESASDGYFKRLQQAAIEAAQEAAAACHDRLIIDLCNMSPGPKLQKFLVRVTAQCTEVGLELRVVGGAEMAKLLKQLVETAEIPVVESVEAARAA